jgi:hypothetical protein
MAPVPFTLSFRTMCLAYYWTAIKKVSRVMSMVCFAISKSGGQMEDIQLSGPFFCREADCKNGPWKEFRDFSKHLRKKHSEKKSEWDSMIVKRSRVLREKRRRDDPNYDGLNFQQRAKRNREEKKKNKMIMVAEEKEEDRRVERQRESIDWDKEKEESVFRHVVWVLKCKMVDDFTTGLQQLRHHLLKIKDIQMLTLRTPLKECDEWASKKGPLIWKELEKWYKLMKSQLPASFFADFDGHWKTLKENCRKSQIRHDDPKVDWETWVCEFYLSLLDEVNEAYCLECKYNAQIA